MASHPILAERAALSDLFDELGPDAPTDCGDWTAHQLAAHLWTREHRLDAGPGLVVGGVFGRHTAKLEHKAAQRPYRELVEALRSGPPWRWPGTLAPSVDTHEWFVHHEDVRRPAGRERRTDLGELDGPLWKSLGRMGKPLTRRVGVGVELHTPDGRTQTVQSGETPVVLTGDPGELMRFLFGRTAAVQLDGEPAAIEAFESATIGF